MSDTLNPPQRDAVRYLDGPLLVLAGAGSGKTRVITHKIGYLIRECGIAPTRIAAITFTNKAAKEMRERAGKLVGGAAEGLIVSTFHALGARILREEARHAGLKPGFSILDAGDAANLFQELAGNVDKVRIRLMAQRISLWKNALVDPGTAQTLAADPIESAAAALYASYQRTLAAYQAVDFDDLLRLPVTLFEQESAVAERWRGRLWHLLVDEYQDTNAAQYRLLRLLTETRDAFTAVGDDDQSIYAWRGASAQNLALLREHYPRLKVIKLEQNYRSSQRILTAANALIAHNPKAFEKRLWSEHGPGDAIRIEKCRDGDHEAQWVVARLMALKFERRAKFADFAILYRGNHQARAFEEQLRNHRVPYVLSGGQSFFERSEIKDLIAYLRLLANPDDDPAFIRAVTTPRRGIGGGTLEALGQAAGRRRAGLLATTVAPGLETELNARQQTLLREFGDFIRRFALRAGQEAAGTVLGDLLAAIGYEAWLFETLEPREAENRVGNVREFVTWLTRRGEEDGKTLLELAQTIALLSMLDKNAEGDDAVQLATLHAAKGLEFRHVFLVGVEEGMLPHRDSVDPARLEEERRLMYVGITRAQASLAITWCERRRQGSGKQGSEWLPREPSRFIAEMGESVQRSDAERNAVADATSAKARLAEVRARLAGR